MTASTKYPSRENAVQPASFIRGSASRRNGCALFNPRCSHDDSFPRGRDRLRLPVPDKLGVRANHDACHPRAGGEDGAAERWRRPRRRPTKPRSAESLECSKEADAKGVHGKERKKFMSDCKKAAMAKPKT